MAALEGVGVMWSNFRCVRYDLRANRQDDYDDDSELQRIRYAVRDLRA